MKSVVSPDDLATMLVRLIAGLRQMTSVAIIVTGFEEGEGEGSQGVMRADFTGQFAVDQRYVNCATKTLGEMIGQMIEDPIPVPPPDDPLDLQAPIRCGFPLDPKREERCANQLPCEQHPSFFIVPPQTAGH